MLNFCRDYKIAANWVSGQLAEAYQRVQPQVRMGLALAEATEAFPKGAPERPILSRFVAVLSRFGVTTRKVATDNRRRSKSEKDDSKQKGRDRTL